MQTVSRIISALSFSTEVWMSLLLGAIVTIVIAYIIYRVQKKESIQHKHDHDTKLEEIKLLHQQDSEKIKVLYELIIQSQRGSIGEVEAANLEQKIEDAADLITEQDSDKAQTLKAIAEKDSDKADELLDKLVKYEHDLEELYNLHAMNEHRLGNYPDEIPWREKLVALKPDNYEYKLRLFNALIVTGRYDEAEQLAQETIATLRAATEPDKLNILNWMYTLGSVNLQKAKPELAEEYFKQALEYGTGFLGTEHTELFNIYNDLGCVCLNKGDNTKAEEYFRFALKMHIVEDADDAVNHGYMICNIATALKGQGKIDEATSLYLEGLQQLIKTVGVDHPALNFYYGHLGIISYVQKNFLEAKEYFLKVKTIFEHKHMDTVPQYAINLNWLGHVHLALKIMDEAEEYYQKALSTIQGYDPNDRSITQTKHYIADVYLDSNRPRKAEQMLKEVISDWENYPDADKADLLRSYSQLGILQLGQDRYSEAETNLNQAIALQTEISHPKFADLILAKHSLADLYVITERYSEAESLLLQILPVLEKDNAAESKYPEVLNKMSDICLKLERQTEAEEYKAKAEEYKAKAEELKARLEAEKQQSPIEHKE